MRARTRLTAVMVAILTVAAMLWSTVPASRADAAAPNSAATYQDYLAPAGAGVSVATGGVGTDQCAAAVSNRKGRWACPTTGAAPAAYWDWCDAWSCRHRTDDFKSDEQLNATWGCGGTTLGAVQVYASMQLTGPKTLSKPVYYYNTSASQSVVITGDLLNSAPGAAGTEVSGAFNLYNAGNVPGAQQISWSPNGYLSYDNKNLDHSQVHQWSWNDTSSDCSAGYWYVYMKSTCTHTQDRITYRFDAVSQLPVNPDGGGWRT